MSEPRSGTNQYWFDSLRQDEPTDKAWTRLLRLHPGGFDDTIVCDMYVVSLDSKPVYDAMSYCWGSTSLTQSITINGRAGFGVTENLHNASRRVRRPHDCRIIWANAICINQANDVEKSKQVWSMPRIYYEAKKLCIYLGECSWQHPDECCVQRSAAQLRLDLQRFPDFSMNGLDDASTNEGLDPWMKANDTMGSVSATKARRPLFFAADIFLKELQKDKFVSPWWRRTWTIQESILSSNRIVYYGSYVLEWQGLFSFWQRYVRIMMPSTVFQTYLENDDFRLYIYTLGKLTWELRVSLGIYELLSAAANHELSNPSDRVYALMGLTSGSSILNLMPNYTIPPKSLFSEVAIHVMRSTGQPEILLCL